MLMPDAAQAARLVAQAAGEARRCAGPASGTVGEGLEGETTVSAFDRGGWSGVQVITSGRNGSDTDDSFFYKRFAARHPKKTATYRGSYAHVAVAVRNGTTAVCLRWQGLLRPQRVHRDQRPFGGGQVHRCPPCPDPVPARRRGRVLPDGPRRMRRRHTRRQAPALPARRHLPGAAPGGPALCRPRSAARYQRHLGRHGVEPARGTVSRAHVTRARGSGRAYVPAYSLSRWGNDEARDNDGAVIPDCG